VEAILIIAAGVVAFFALAIIFPKGFLPAIETSIGFVGSLVEGLFCLSILIVFYGFIGLVILKLFFWVL